MGARDINARSTADRQHMRRCGIGSTAALAVERHDGQGRTTIRLTGELGRDPGRSCAGSRPVVWPVACTPSRWLAMVALDDCSGLIALLQAHRREAVVGAALRLHDPRPVASICRSRREALRLREDLSSCPSSTGSPRVTSGNSGGRASAARSVTAVATGTSRGCLR